MLVAVPRGKPEKMENGVLTQSVNIDGKTVNFRAERGLPHGNAHEVHFSWDDSDVTFATLLDHAGELPIPPYLNRETEESDKTTYQTVYSKIEGSVAAPTRRTTFYSGSTEQTERKEHTHSRTDFTRGSRYIQTGKKRNSRRARDAHRIYLGEPQPHR